MLTTYVLGAGFSRYGGLPLGDELFAEIVKFARRDHLYDNFLKPDLERYQLFLRRTTGRRVNAAAINFERFMSFLDIEHTLRLTGSDTWGEQGNQTQLLVRNLIAQVLWHRQHAMSAGARTLYDSFAAQLDDTDIVFTFNYDTLLEDALDRCGKKYRLFPARYATYDEHTGGTLALDSGEIVILKMHGSIDWFDRSGFDSQVATWQALKYNLPPPDEVFSRSYLQIEPIVSGLYAPESPLNRIYRVRNLEKYLWNATNVGDAPLVISPSFSKILYVNPVREFWYGFGYNGSYARRMVIVGFSMPAHDEYIQQAIYSLVRNFQHFDLGANQPKSKLTIVDYRTTVEGKSALRKTYRFAVAAKTKFIFSGFAPSTLRGLAQEAG